MAVLSRCLLWARDSVIVLKFLGGRRNGVGVLPLRKPQYPFLYLLLSSLLSRLRRRSLEEVAILPSQASLREGSLSRSRLIWQAVRRAQEIRPFFLPVLY